MCLGVIPPWLAMQCHVLGKECTMNTVRDEYTTIVGVDTHARTHTYALLQAASGLVMDTATFPASPTGLTRAIAWIDRRRAPGRTLLAIEGTNSYGATLTRALAATDLEVCEVRPPRRASRAGRGKSDDIDALAAARTVLAQDVSALLQPRAGGNRQALRILLNARDATERQSTADCQRRTNIDPLSPGGFNSSSQHRRGLSMTASW